MLPKARLPIPRDWSVAWFSSSFSEIPWICFPEALHPQGQPGGQEALQAFREWFVKWSQVWGENGVSTGGCAPPGRA